MLLRDLSESRAFVHGQMISLVAFNQILRLFFRGTDHVVFEPHRRRNLFLDRSADAACFRVPTHMISYFELTCHLCLLRRNDRTQNL